MNIKDLADKYSLERDDFWELPQKKDTWILTHNAVEKIINQENIEVTDWETLNSEVDLVRFKITMSMTSEDGDIRTVTTIGEADRKNCFAKYLGCMAEKRGIDRGALKLISAYEYGVFSEVEAEDFKKANE
tara:strand:- start:420 stop:812 length:393 start_codon:yes stop_codon:yes gene_type:complete